MTNEKLVLGRTLGFEIECGVANESRVKIEHLDVDYDGSVDMDYSDEVELKTKPLNNLNIVKGIYDQLNDEHEMEVNRSCGLHIHVDISDFDGVEKAKLLRFGKGIEHIMYAIVDDSRDGNGYSEPIHNDWRKVFRSSFIAQPLKPTCDHIENVQWYIRDNMKNPYGNNVEGLWNGKYQWMNCATPFDTVEFRIFDATTDGDKAIKYGMLAYHIVETVKNSTIKQINFIVKSIYEACSMTEALERFYTSIGLDNEFWSETQNYRRVQKIDDKFFKPNREAVANQESEAI